MLCICGLWFVCLYVSDVFAASGGEISAGLSHVRLVEGFARHFVDAAFVKVVCHVMMSCFGSLLYCVCCFLHKIRRRHIDNI